jgi:hypothetical protein
MNMVVEEVKYLFQPITIGDVEKSSGLSLRLEEKTALLPTNVIHYGTSEPLPERITLRAGPWTMERLLCAGSVPMLCGRF